MSSLFWWVKQNKSPTSFSLSKGLQQDVVPQHQTNRSYSSYLWYLSKLRFPCHIYYLASKSAILFKHITFFHNHFLLSGLKSRNIPHSNYTTIVSNSASNVKFFSMFFIRHLSATSKVTERWRIVVVWFLQQHSEDVGGGVWYVRCNAERFEYRER